MQVFELKRMEVDFKKHLNPQFNELQRLYLDLINLQKFIEIKDVLRFET